MQKETCSDCERRDIIIEQQRAKLHVYRLERETLKFIINELLDKLQIPRQAG